MKQSREELSDYWSRKYAEQIERYVMGTTEDKKANDRGYKDEGIIPTIDLAADEGSTESSASV